MTTKTSKNQLVKKVLKKHVNKTEGTAVAEIDVKTKKDSKREVKKTKKDEENNSPVEAVHKEENTKTSKVKKDVEEKKVLKTKKDEQPIDIKEEPEEEKKVKKAKKINDKPTLSDNCGLNLSVAKVKNIMSNLCINEEPFLALKELKEHKVLEEEKSEENSDGKKKKRAFTFTLKGLSSQTISYLEKAYDSNLESLKESFSKNRIKMMDEVTKKDYLQKRKDAVIAHQLDQKNDHLFHSHEFNTTKFNTEWDKNFYEDMEIPEWKTLEDMELYDYCVTLINKMKVRFNSESKIFVTAFVEHIIQQMVLNGTINCVASGKKIIKLDHALDTSTEGFESRFSLYPLILNLETFQKIRQEDSTSEEVESESETKAETLEEEEKVDRKYQFKYYVAELCRTVKMELARADMPDNITQSVYFHTSVSKVFKNFCSNIIVDLIRMFGEVLKVEVSTRNIKTVNYTIIQTLVKVVHIVYGLNTQLDETVQFIQKRYRAYQKFIEERKNKRGAKLDEEEEEEEI